VAKSKKSKEPIIISFEVQEYWDKAQEIVKLAGAYASAEKLRVNLEDEATRWKVQRVLTRYYEGDENLLRDTIHYRRRQVMNAIREFNTIAANNGRLEISKPNSLINFLLDEDRRRKYINFSEKHRKKNELVDLQRVEMEFREWREKRLKKMAKK